MQKVEGITDFESDMIYKHYPKIMMNLNKNITRSVIAKYIE